VAFRFARPQSSQQIGASVIQNEGRLYRKSRLVMRRADLGGRDRMVRVALRRIRRAPDASVAAALAGQLASGCTLRQRRKRNAATTIKTP
jgi:hypothetical protein